MTWTPERIDILKSEWENGIHASEIGARLGVTKDAVRAKAYALGLLRPLNGFWEANGGEKTKHLVKLLAARTTTALIAADLGTTKNAVCGKIKRGGLNKPKSAPVGKPLSEIGPLDCRYPYGDETPYQFCGKRAQPGSPYCAQHHYLTHTHKPAAQMDEAA